MNIKLKSLLSEVLEEGEANIKALAAQYVKDTEYDVENSLGSCSFFTRDVMNWAKKKGIKVDYVYMPQSKEYRTKHNIDDENWEDHIVPMINNYLIDFAMTDKGLSKHIRTKNTIPPVISRYSKALFAPNGLYGKYGYTTSEINTEYGNPKDINAFDVSEPRKK